MREGLGRKLLALLAITALAACQTVPAKPGFSAKQVAALTQEEFKPVGENYELGLSDLVLFEVDKSDLSPEAAQRIGKLVGVLKSVNIDGAGVEGHTDSTGSDAYNQTLSENRARTVMNYLISQGVPAARLRSQGFGETMPVADNTTAEGRAKNRRVEIKIVPVTQEDVQAAKSGS
jgi:OOP family OmpA-OmpF porin